MNLTTFDPVVITKLISAPVGEVWKAWTDPGAVLKWYGSDPNGWGVSSTLDVRAGGAYEICFSNSDGSEHTCRGVFLEVREPEQLIFNWEWKSEPGVVSTVKVVLAPEGTGTRMHFEHSGVGDKSAHDYYYGWEGAFAKLEKLLNPSI